MQTNLEAFYEIQFLVSASQAIGGSPYWSPLGLFDGKRQTTDLQVAQACYQTALREVDEPVRLVKFTPELVHSNF